jgi:Cysteine rich repeat
MKSWLIALGCLGLSALGAQAQDAPSSPPSGQPVRAACADDLKKLCPDVQPGGGRIRACIASHRDELSPGCRAALKQARGQRAPGPNPAPPDQPAKPQQ